MPDDPVRISDLGALDELRPTDLVEVERVFPDGSRVSGRVSGAQVAGVAAPMPQERLLGRLADTGTGAPVPIAPEAARVLIGAGSQIELDDAASRVGDLESWSDQVGNGTRPLTGLAVTGNASVGGDLTVSGVVLDPAAIAAAQAAAEDARDAALGAQNAAEDAADILSSATFANRLMVATVAGLPAAAGLDEGVIAEVTADGAANTGIWQVQDLASVLTWVKVSDATTPGNKAAIAAEVAARQLVIQQVRSGRYRLVGWDRETGEVAFGVQVDNALAVLGLQLSDVLAMRRLRVPGYAEVKHDRATGGIVWGLTDAGVQRTLGIDIGKAVQYRTLRIPGNPALVEYSLQTGFIRARVEQDGTRVDISQGEGAVTVPERTGGITAEVYHVAALTQSWGAGTGGNPPLTTTPQPRVLMPNGGIRFNENGISSPLSSLIPAFEQLREGTNRGETPWSSFAQAFLQQAIADPNVDDSGFYMALTAVTPGGETIAGVSPGSSNWTAWQNGVAAMYNLNVAAGRTYRLIGVPMMIGKGDYDAIAAASPTDQPDRTLYRDKILTIAAAANAFVRTLDPRHPDVPVFWYQTLSHTHNGAGRFPNPVIDWAAQDAAAIDPRVVVLAPMWAYADDDDSVHYTGPSYQGMGAAGGVCAYRYSVGARDEAGRPGLPEKLVRQGRTVIAWYPAEVGPLMFDDENVVDPGDFGCRIFDAGSGTYLTLAEPPTIVAGRGVKMVATVDVPSTCRYRTGGDDVLGGGIGNVAGVRCCLRRVETVDVAVGALTVVARAWATSVDVQIP